MISLFGEINKTKCKQVVSDNNSKSQGFFIKDFLFLLSILNIIAQITNWKFDIKKIIVLSYEKS